MHHTTVAALVRRGHCVGCGCTGRTNGAATALSVLRRAHDHHRNLPTLDAAARAAGFSRINRDDDAVTRHGSYLLRRVVASPHRPSPYHAPGDTPAPSITPIPHVIADFAHPRHRSSALIAATTAGAAVPGSRVNTTPVTLSTRNSSNPHKPRTAHRGFVPRGHSYAKRRPKLFTEAERPLSSAQCRRADIRSWRLPTAGGGRVEGRLL